MNEKTGRRLHLPSLKLVLTVGIIGLLGIGVWTANVAGWFTHKVAVPASLRLQCLPGELSGEVIFDFLGDTGGPLTPAETVARQVREMWPKVDATAFVRVDGDSAQQRWALIRDSRVRAIVRLERIGGTWTVPTMSGCNGLVKNGE